MSPFSQTQGLDADDPILELAVAFAQETRPQKVNLAIGTYKTDHGDSWVLPSIIQAEETLISSHLNKDYLPIEGDHAFLQCVSELLLGETLFEKVQNHIVTVQSVGGTSALRLAADYLRLATERHLYVSEPTWPNHPSLCQQAGLQIGRYPYYNTTTKALDLEALLESFKNMPKGSAVLLHACCHNPTGLDPSSDQWQLILDALQQYELFPFFDIAYQGFAEGVKEDAAPLRNCIERGMECLIANSFSKNFGLYGERIGTLTAFCSTPSIANKVRKQLKTLIRRTFSNPPLHGQRLVKTILTSPTLRSQWEEEVTIMRTRIITMRTLFLEALCKKGKNLPFLANQKGLFSYGWLSKEEVHRLKKEFAIYLPDNGRITIPGLTHQNLDYVVNALFSVTLPTTTAT